MFKTARFLRSRVLLVATIAGLMAGSSLAASAATPAGAIGGGITVHCPADLQAAINNAAPGSTIRVDGTCTGSYYIDKDLTVAGPAVLDAGGTGVVLNVMSGTVVLNDLTIQHGTGIYSFGGGLWNGGQLTLNRSTVTNNSAFSVGGVFNYGQLTLSRSIVSHNTSTYNGGGIFNCGASFHDFGLCTGAPGRLTLNGSTVSDNVVAGGSGGGIDNDGQAFVTLNGSTVSGNVAQLNGGGIANDAQANLTINLSSVSGNTAGSTGGISNDGTATLNTSAVSNNSSTGPMEFWGGGGGIRNTGPTTLNNSIVRDNSAAFIGGGVFAGGPMTINKSMVTGNSAGSAGGGLLAWDGPTTVANSVFWSNSDQNTLGWDTLPGVAIGPVNFGGFFVNHPTFTNTQSIFHS